MKKLAFNVTEAAEVLGVSKSQMYRSIRDGTIPCIMMGGRKLISAAALEEFIAKQGTDEATTKEEVVSGGE